MDEAEFRVAIERDLCSFLGDSFSNLELRRWLVLLGPSEQQLVDELPGPEIPRAEYVFQVVQGLKRRRLLDARLFDTLELERPQRVLEIRALKDRAMRSPQLFIGHMLLAQVEPVLDEKLQRAFALAFAQTRRQKKKRISTERLIAAILRLAPDVMSLFPSGALPSPTPAGIGPDPDVFHVSPPVSSCVEHSLDGLSRTLTALDMLSPHDMLVDLARYGTSPVIRRMRDRGVGPQEVETIARQLGRPLVRR